MCFLASGWQLWHSLQELTRNRESSFLHITQLFPKKKTKKARHLNKEIANEKSETCTGCYDRGTGEKRALKVLVPWAAAFPTSSWWDPAGCTHRQPTYPSGSVLWMPFPFPKTFTKCEKIWKGLNHVLWSNWQEGEDLRVNMWNQGEGEQAAALMGWTQPLQVSQEHIHVTAMVKAMGQAVTVVLRN